jgi:uncharacterized lipoprotein YmbA
MTNRCEAIVVWGMVCLCATLLAGCPSTQPSKFYVLSPLSSPEQTGNASLGNNALAIGIGPIEIPAYLDRPQIVKRRSSHELELAEFHKWGEPLKANISRVLGENLSGLLLTDEIYLFPWKRSAPFHYQVLVRITRFDTSPEGDAILNARWEIRAYNERDVLAIRRSHFRTPESGQGYQSTVSAMSRNLDDLSQVIATTIKSLHSNQPMK